MAVTYARTSLGLKFTGMITCPTDGLYHFETRSDDGSRFYLNDKIIVENGGPHKQQSRRGSITLEKGIHAFLLTHFNNVFGGPSVYHGNHLVALR